MKIETVPIDTFLRYVKVDRYEQLREIIDEMWTVLQFMPHVDIEKHDAIRKNLESKHKSLLRQYDIQKCDIRRKYYDEYLVLENRVKNRIGLPSTVAYVPTDMYDKEEHRQYRRIETRERNALTSLRDELGLDDIRARISEFKQVSYTRERRVWRQFSQQYPWFFKMFSSDIILAEDLSSAYKVCESIADKYSEEVYSDIVSRAKSVVGSIRKLEFVNMDDGYLTGMAVGDGGVARIRVNQCGGYNVQTSHYRVTVTAC